MPYKPNFCCQCGEKIERIDWRLFTSRRFCELCATEFGVYDKIPLILVAAGILFGLFGLGTYLRTPEKALNVLPNQLVSSVQNANKNETNRAVSSKDLSNTSVQPPDNSVVQTQNLNVKKTETLAAEIVYFCGAPTKKGTPCSRRVKGGGRCWQHTGQTAMHPQEKLRIGK